MDYGWSINAQDHGGRTPLCSASEDGQLGIVKGLLQMGAMINKRSPNYGTALVMASHAGHDRVVEFLLNRGVDVRIQGLNYGRTLAATAVGCFAACDPAPSSASSNA